MQAYPLIASPTIYSGQTVQLRLSASDEAQVQLFIRAYNQADKLTPIDGPRIDLAAGTYQQVRWRLPSTQGQPIAQIGLAYAGEAAVSVYLDSLTWDGAPDLNLTRPRPGEGENPGKPQAWQRAWVNGLDRWDTWAPEPYRLMQNRGRGLLTQGTREWTDYEVAATITPVLMAKGGLGVRAQGQRRYYALLLCDDHQARLIKALDGDRVLAAVDFNWQFNQPYTLRLQAKGTQLRAWIDGQLLCSVRDTDRSLSGGAAALVIEEGHLTCHALRVKPVPAARAAR